MPVGNVVANGTRSVFFMSVVLVNFGPIWPWLRGAGNNFLTDQNQAAAPCLPTPALNYAFLRVSLSFFAGSVFSFFLKIWIVFL